MANLSIERSRLQIGGEGEGEGEGEGGGDWPLEMQIACKLWKTASQAGR